MLIWYEIHFMLVWFQIASYLDLFTSIWAYKKSTWISTRDPTPPCGFTWIFGEPPLPPWSSTWFMDVPSVHDEVKVDCPICKQSCKNAWYRDRHIKANHGISPKGLDLKKIVNYGENSGFLPLPNGKVQCMKCQKILSNMGNAKIHFKQGGIHFLRRRDFGLFEPPLPPCRCL